MVGMWDLCPRAWRDVQHLITAVSAQLAEKLRAPGWTTENLPREAPCRAGYTHRTGVGGFTALPLDATTSA